MPTRTLIAVLTLIAAPVFLHAQRGQGPPAPPPTAKAAAAIDLTGTWVSVIGEDWWLRMVTPRKGDYTHLALTPAARKVADAWDPAKDEAAGEQCKGYGAAAITRLPGRLRITWQDDHTMKLEYEAGNQIRVFHFGTAPPPAPPSWQGASVAEWRYTAVPPRSGELKVVTSRLKPGYLRKNGVPYSANTRLTEYWDVFTGRGGDRLLVITSIVEDPANLQREWITSLNFRKEPNGAKWDPTPCSTTW